MILVRPHYHGERVPSNYRADAPLDRSVAGIMRLPVGRDRVEVWRVCIIWEVSPAQARGRDQLFEKKMRPIDSLCVNHRLQRVEPFTSFLGVYVLNLFHRSFLHQRY